MTIDQISRCCLTDFHYDCQREQPRRVQAEAHQVDATAALRNDAPSLSLPFNAGRDRFLHIPTWLFDMVQTLLQLIYELLVKSLLSEANPVSPPIQPSHSS